MRITAAVTEEKGAPFALEEVELGELREDEVLVRIAAAGICHTDLICRDQWYPVPLPAVLGHEGAGTVERVGGAVAGFRPGDRVAISYHSCGRCRSCESGRPFYCYEFFEHNFGASRRDGTSALSRDGELVHAHFFGQSSFATHVVANERNLVRLEGAIPFELAAPLGCGIQTGAGAVLNGLQAREGSSVAVFGTGAVGLSAIMAAKVAGCATVIGVDLRAPRLELARELCATHVLDPHERNPVEAIEEITGTGVDYSLETTGSPQVLRLAVDCTAPAGVTGVIGAPAFGTEVVLDVNTILTGGRRVCGIVEGESIPQVFLPRLIGLWEEGRFPIERLVTVYDFDQIEQAARDAEAGTAIKPVLRFDRRSGEASSDTRGDAHDHAGS